MLINISHCKSLWCLPHLADKCRSLNLYTPINEWQYLWTWVLAARILCLDINFIFIDAQMHRCTAIEESQRRIRRPLEPQIRIFFHVYSRSQGGSLNLVTLCTVHYTSKKLLSLNSLRFQGISLNLGRYLNESKNSSASPIWNFNLVISISYECTQLSSGVLVLSIWLDVKRKKSFTML